MDKKIYKEIDIDFENIIKIRSAIKKRIEDIEKIKKKYGLISKMFLRGPDEHRAIIKLEKIGGE